jgi:hypothetical protein
MPINSFYFSVCYEEFQRMDWVSAPENTPFFAETY